MPQNKSYMLQSDMARVGRYIREQRAYEAFTKTVCELRDSPPDAPEDSWEHSVWVATRDLFAIADDKLREYMADCVEWHLVNALERIGGHKIGWGNSCWVAHEKSGMSLKFCTKTGFYAEYCVKETALVQERAEKMCVECRRKREEQRKSRAKTRCHKKSK